VDATLEEAERILMITFIALTKGFATTSQGSTRIDQSLVLFIEKNPRYRSDTIVDNGSVLAQGGAVGIRSGAKELVTRTTSSGRPSPAAAAKTGHPPATAAFATATAAKPVITAQESIGKIQSRRSLPSRRHSCDSAKSSNCCEMSPSPCAARSQAAHGRQVRGHLSAALTMRR